MIDAWQRIHLMVEFLDFQQGLAIEDIAVLNPQHDLEAFGAAETAGISVIQKYVMVVTGKEVDEARPDLHSRGPITHENGDRDQQDTNRRPEAKDQLADIK